MLEGSIELGPEKHKTKVVEGYFPVPSHLELSVLHEIPGLVAWVGRKDENGRVLDASPVFIQDPTKPTPLTATRAGIVLLCDMARDFTIENRISKGNFTVGNVDRLETHVKETYGLMTLQYLEKEFASGKPLGTDNARYIAKRLVRILRVNYPELKFDGVTSKSRIILSKPFTILSRIHSGARIANLAGLALGLGSAWVEAETTLLRKRPELADRSQYFGDGEVPKVA